MTQTIDDLEAEYFRECCKPFTVVDYLTIPPPRFFFFFPPSFFSLSLSLSLSSLRISSFPHQKKKKKKKKIKIKKKKKIGLCKPQKLLRGWCQDTI